MKDITKVWVFTLCLLSATAEVAGQMHVQDVSIDFSRSAKPLRHFWKSTGFTPAENMALPVMRQHIGMLGDISGKAIAYNRPHYMLNLVAAWGFEQGQPQYDFTCLDDALDLMLRHGQRPIFELMGKPHLQPEAAKSSYQSGKWRKGDKEDTYFTDFTEKQQIRHWKTFVQAVATHLIARYGAAEVQQWYFETVNEPDHDLWWWHGVPAFLNYYDACSEGLKAADPKLRFGGPGNAFHLSEYFKAMLAHCDTGTNFFTGEKGVRLDFISVHIKNMPIAMLRREQEVVQYIRTHHPRFAQTPFWNDEADPIVGWSRNLWFHASAWYAACMAQMVDTHQRILIDSLSVPYGLLSNDHGFVGNWYNRTMTAMFDDAADTTRKYLVKKPSYHAMGMLAQLGNEYIAVDIPPAMQPYFGAIATRIADGKGYAVLLYNKTDINIGYKGNNRNMLNQSEIATMMRQSFALNLTIKGIAAKHVKIQHRCIDDVAHGNAHNLWLETGSPGRLTETQYRQLAARAEPGTLADTTAKVKRGTLHYHTTIYSPSLHLLLIQ